MQNEKQTLEQKTRSKPKQVLPGLAKIAEGLAEIDSRFKCFTKSCSNYCTQTPPELAGIVVGSAEINSQSKYSTNGCPNYCTTYCAKCDDRSCGEDCFFVVL